ncbi:MAG: Uncharacterised protein [Synechococcus sp. MIT S9220]|nr:MAG: Uncharacterised protein [Synechococcus sp. MIT S9220]
MGQHLKRLVLADFWPGRREPLDDLEAGVTDGGAHGHILISDQTGLLPSGNCPFRRRQRQHTITHTLQRPAQIHSCGARGIELVKCRRQGCITGVILQSQHQAIGTGHPDQRSATNHHGADGRSRLLTAAEGAGSEAMRQLGLINHPDGATVRFQSDGAPGLAINIHPDRVDRPGPICLSASQHPLEARNQ